MQPSKRSKTEYYIPLAYDWTPLSTILTRYSLGCIWPSGILFPVEQAAPSTGVSVCCQSTLKPRQRVAYLGAAAAGKSRTWRIGEKYMISQERIDTTAPTNRVERSPIAFPR